MFMFNTKTMLTITKKKKKSFICIRKEICLALLSYKNISIFNLVCLDFERWFTLKPVQSN